MTRLITTIGLLGFLGSIIGPAATAAAQDVPRAAPPQAKDDAEKKVLDVIAELDANRAGNLNVPRDDGRMLRLLAETTGARRVVEIGTSNGYSGLWFALALRQTGGTLTTFEIDPGRAARAKASFEKAGVADLITVVLGDAHENVTRLEGPIDIVFIDADNPGYLDYLTKVLPMVRPGGLILAHNVTSPRPDPKFIEAITTNPALETLFYNERDQGLAITLKKK
jgi:predicted O-methyltransferase YrrM